MKGRRIQQIRNKPPGRETRQAAPPSSSSGVCCLQSPSPDAAESKPDSAQYGVRNVLTLESVWDTCREQSMDSGA